MHELYRRGLEDEESGSEHHDPSDVKQKAIEFCAGGARCPVQMCDDQNDGAKGDHRLAQSEYRMWQAQDLDVESVGRMPPGVKRRGDEHREATPGRHEASERPAEAPHRYGGVAIFIRGTEGRRENCVTTSYPGENSCQVDHHVRGGPERVTSD